MGDALIIVLVLSDSPCGLPRTSSDLPVGVGRGGILVPRVRLGGSPSVGVGWDGYSLSGVGLHNLPSVEPDGFVSTLAGFSFKTI